MWVEVGLIVSGIPVGYALRKQPMAINFTNRALSAVIYALLFLIGLSLGGNEDLTARLAELGVQGVLLGILCAGGSIFATWLLYSVIFKAKKS